jgi:cellobiose-specific phosphotransferase system component IIB
VIATTSLLTAEIDPNSVRPGWVALLIVLALGAATALLVRNMGKQLKKIDFDGDGADAPAPSDGPATTDSSLSPAGDAEPTDTAATTEKPTQSDSKEHSQH